MAKDKLIIGGTGQQGQIRGKNPWLFARHQAGQRRKPSALSGLMPCKGE
jgi:hypothetical protein